MVSLLHVAIASSTALTAWECYLLYRQRRAHAKNTPKPSDVELSDEKFEEVRQYAVDRVDLGIVNLVKSLVEGVSLTLVLPQLYSAAHRWLSSSALVSSLVAPSALSYGSFAHGWAFMGLCEVLNTALGLPLSIYATFWQEAKHGFNKTTKQEFAKDTVKVFLLKVLLLNPIIGGMLHGAVHFFGERFPMYLFGGSVVLMLAMTYVLPAVIQPLFNKFTPLPQGTEFETQVRALAAKLSFPLTKMYVMDGSRRSGHSNAYFYGFWKSKRIVFYDTLLDQMTVPWKSAAQLEEEEKAKKAAAELVSASNNEQTVEAAKTEEEETKKKTKKVSNCGARGALAVLCHEFGHWYHNHTTFLLGLSLAQLFVMCYGAKLFMFYEPIFLDFGFAARDVGNPLIGFQLFSGVVVEPLMTFVMYAMSFVSRKFEFQADEFAVGQGFGEELEDALKVLQEENKSSVTPDWLYSMLHYSHPPMRERLAAIRQLVALQRKKKE